MRTNGGTIAPLGQVMSRGRLRAAAASVSPSCSRLTNPRLPHEELKSPTISRWAEPVARTFWPAAARADRVSVQEDGNGARLWNTRTWIGPPEVHTVAVTR